MSTLSPSDLSILEPLITAEYRCLPIEVLNARTKNEELARFVERLRALEAERYILLSFVWENLRTGRRGRPRRVKKFFAYLLKKTP